MTDKEKIKAFIMWQDLRLKGDKELLNAEGIAALMRLNEICKDWKGADIIKLVNKLGGEKE